MSAFPASLIPSQASDISPNRGLKAYTTEGGGVRGRVQYSQALYYLTLIYEDLTDTEHDLIVSDPASHFDADPTGPHTVIVRGDTYNVNYQAQPAVIEHHGILRTVQVNFVGTKQ